MKSPNKRIFHSLLVLFVLISALHLPAPAQAAGVVTNCTSQAGLQAALSGGGLITFNCGTATIPITSTLEITAANTTIDGGGTITLQGTSGVRMILHRTLVTTPSTLTLQNLIIRDAAISGNGSAANGAAIRSVNNSLAPPQHPQTLNVINVQFINNVATQTATGLTGYDYGGGAIFTQGGNLIVRNSTFSGNKSFNGAGGAIHGLRSNITITDSTFTGNVATAIAPSNTDSGYGGAIYVDGALSSGNGRITITGASFSQNSAANQGGVAYVNLYTAQNESLIIDRSSFIENTVSGGGMGIGGALSGGGTNNGSGAARITITNSYFGGNQISTNGTRGASGGAIGFAQTAHIVIANSTFYNNKALGLCTQCWNANGGAIYIVNNPVPWQVLNSTFLENHADWVGGAITASQSGVLRNSVMMNNTGANGGNGWNIQQNCGQQVTGGNNVQWPALHPTDGNDRLCSSGTTIADPKLGLPGANGGPTLTIPLLPGSPALQAGDNSICTRDPVQNLDARGRARITVGNPVCDLGAYEVGAVTPGDTVGVFRPSNTQFLLRNANTTGPADIASVFGGANDLPVAGDWNGDGIDTIGLFRTSTAQFFLRNSNVDGATLAHSFTFGGANDLPMAGDWDNDGRDGVGVFRNGRIFLRNTLSTGPADFTMLLGTAGDRPVAGDWDGNGVDSPGIFRPTTAAFFLTNQVCNCTPGVNFGLTLGNPGDVGFAGDWDGNGTSGVGVFRPTNGVTYLRNALTTGFADVAMIYGIANDRPIAGRWAIGPMVLTTAPSAAAPAAPESAPEFGADGSSSSR